MSELHNNHKFMYAYGILDELKRQTQSEWENQLIDDFDDYDTVPRDYRNRICIDDAAPADWDSLADKRLRGRGAEFPQEQDLRSKVDWSNAPPKARYWTMDSDGKAYWCESRPTLGVYGWIDRNNGVSRAPGFFWPAYRWKESLVERPPSKDRERSLKEMVENAEELGLYDDPHNPPLSQQIGGDHYSRQEIQPVEFIHANDLGFCEGNCVKYLCRWRHKGGIQDLEKAKHYIEMLIEMEKGNGDY